MRPTSFSPDAVTTLLRKQKVATMVEIMEALGTKARRTVFRKLSELSYRTSYSHRGRYYTLDSIAQFDELGLWSYNDIWFSVCGTLLSTATVMVENAEYGYFIDPHTAVGYLGACRFLEKDARSDHTCVILGTAHPAKFGETVEKATGKRPELPAELKRTLDLPKEATEIEPDLAALERELRRRFA